MTTSTITNRYAGICSNCSVHIEAGAGLAFRNGARWAVRHEDCGKFGTSRLERSRMGAAMAEISDINYTLIEYWDLLTPEFRAEKLARIEELKTIR